MDMFLVELNYTNRLPKRKFFHTLKDAEEWATSQPDSELGFEIYKLVAEGYKGNLVEY